MTTFQCTQCSKGPCTLTRARDPYAPKLAGEKEEIGCGCPNDGIFTKYHTAFWEVRE